MNDIHYLITGSTGDTGGAAARQLLARGAKVRALAHNEDERTTKLRDLGAEIFVGDFLDYNAMREATKGMHRAYFCYPIRPGIIQASAYFAQAAKEAGIDGIVNMSQKTAREDAKSHASQDHWLAERVFDWSGVPVAHIRPTYFAEWLLYLAPMIRAGALHVPFGEGRHAPITAEDQARVVVGILQDPAAHAGKIYPLFGPTEYTYKEIADVLTQTLGKPIQYKQISFDAMLGMLANSGRPVPEGHSSRTLYGELNSTEPKKPGDSFTVQHLRAVAIDHDNGVFAGTNDFVETIGGRPPTTLEQFINDHRAAFV
jgi:uncharacterized protein YbjT (DUF2867 family)